MTSPPGQDLSLNPWDVEIVQSAGGLMVHLIENRELHTGVDPRALCGRKATGNARVWFALNGCSRCCKAALKAGLEVVVDVDGQLAKVQDVLDGVVRD
jgi:hypothetical protein